MKTKHYFRLAAGAALAFLVSFFLSVRVYAQTDDETEKQRERQEKDMKAQQHAAHEASEASEAEDEGNGAPHHLTAGFGGGLNSNFANGAATTGYAIDQNDYSHGFGLGPEFHLLMEIPLGGQWMISPRVNYSNISSAFTDGTAIGGAPLQTNLALDLHNVGVELLGKFSIDKFHILFGPSLAGIVKQTYAHGNHRAADASTAELPGNHSAFAAIGGGVGYDIPINTKSTMWLSPEAFYSYPFTNLGTGGGNDLHVSTLRTAISLKFDLSPEKPPAPVAPPPPRPLSVTVTAKGVMPNGEAVNEPILPEQTTHIRASEPLLSYVFFEEKSAEIPSRYQRNGATGFTEKQLDGKDPLEANHEVLDIVGSRLKDNSEATVTIVGTNSNSGAERHNLNLSKERAEALRDYLVNTWGISSGRITVDGRNLPELATNPVTPAGMEENRRAEILASDPKITGPVRIENDKSEFNGETLIRYETTVSNPDNIPVSNWRITLDDNGSQVGTESGSGAPPAIIPSKIPDASKYIGQKLHYTLEVTDANGKAVTADGMTTVEKATTSDQKYLERFAMLNFDFDSSKVNEHAEKMLSLIGESVNKEALGVNINGYCDITGTDEYNQALSERRANSTASALQSEAVMPSNVSVAGHGRQDPKFPNDLPEGRMLNRRVEVDIAKSK